MWLAGAACGGSSRTATEGLPYPAPPAQRTHSTVLIHWLALLFSIINATVQLLVPLYALRLGYSGLIIGLLAALPSIANVTLRLTFGRLSDRYGETAILRLGGLFYFASAAGMLLSTWVGLAALVGAQLLQGVARSVFWTVAQTYVTKLPLRGGLNLSLFNGATNLGMVLGIGVAGLWAVVLGYRGAFALLLALALLYIALTLVLASPQTPMPSQTVAPPRTRGRLPSFRLGPLWLAACCSFLSGATWAMAGSFHPVYLARLGYGEKAIGLLLMLLPAGMLASSFVSRQIVERSGSMERLAVGFVVATGLGVAIVPAVHAWPALAAVILATGFCSGVCSLLYQLSVQQHSAWGSRGMTMASVGLFGNLALLVLPTTIGVVLRWVPLNAALVGAGAFLVTLGVPAHLSARDLRVGRAVRARSGEHPVRP